ncbi:MotA/TolQ/ExbB proton channel family protein [Microvenator marinus]|jgi:biopolymer transport protein ExbB/TolQ|uniref:MotA/TolQ/ExbB proton channel family protein n=1 Tax=Microvenator marinus TaxID=2600177 RepID=A0A5B8XYK9_9DELT|nr:MotA/TolQ/ExbB proton channel family protein [Microvenator marinus]QED29063.1 MotA/TolQ/ExbB proton channel family protein [Microvenator marinus]
MGAIAEAFRTGGIWMYLILAVSIFAIGIAIERFIFLFFKYNINAEAFYLQVQKLVMANNIDRAIKLCNAAPSAALPQVVKAGLTRANKGEVEIQNAVEEASLEVVPRIQKRTNALAALGNIATLLGLLGTILGLIEAFEALEKATPENRQRLLARGIALAMNTTAFGLIVAIPSLLAHLVLSGQTKRLMDEIDLYSVKLENLLVSRGKGGVAEE